MKQERYADSSSIVYCVHTYHACTDGWEHARILKQLCAQCKCLWRGLTAEIDWKVASLQQLSRRMTGLVPSPKAQCMRVSLNLIKTPSTLSYDKRLEYTIRDHFRRTEKKKKCKPNKETKVENDVYDQAVEGGRVGEGWQELKMSLQSI